MFELQTKGMTPEQREEWWRRKGVVPACEKAA